MEESLNKVPRIILILIGASALVLIGFLLYHKSPGDREVWSAVTGSLAVLAAVIAVWPSLRIMELQEDSLRPYPVPSIDSRSRYQLTQLKVTNLGAGVAYAVAIEWDSHPSDEQGSEVRLLDAIPVLLPKQNVSTLLGRPWILFKDGQSYTLTGRIRYKDAKGKRLQHRFTCSGHGDSKGLIHDEELPKTLREMQDIPKHLQEINHSLEALLRKP